MNKITKELFHGTIYSFEIPTIKRKKKSSDFGPGFYATSSSSQAKEWALSRCYAKNLEIGYVNIYKLKEHYQKELNIKHFNFKDKQSREEWVDLILKCRNGKNPKMDYDIIYGPLADNHMIEYFILFERKIINKDELITWMTARKDLIEQFCFRTDKAISFLEFQDKITITTNETKNKKTNMEKDRNNFFPILSCIVMNVIVFITEQEHCTFDNAAKRFYHSETYRLLEDKKTAFWHLGPAQLYESFQEESI